MVLSGGVYEGKGVCLQRTFVLPQYWAYMGIMEKNMDILAVPPPPPHSGAPQHEATPQQPLFNTPQKPHSQFVIILSMGAGTRLTMTKNIGGGFPKSRCEVPFWGSP